MQRRQMFFINCIYYREISKSKASQKMMFLLDRNISKVESLGAHGLAMWFCTVCLLTDGRVKKKKTWQRSAPHKKKAVNNRNSIKLHWFPVSYALWTAWTDRLWLAEILLAAACPLPQQGELSIGSVVPYSFVPHLIVVFLLYSAGLKNVSTAMISTEANTQDR